MHVYIWFIFIHVWQVCKLFCNPFHEAAASAKHDYAWCWLFHFCCIFPSFPPNYLFSYYYDLLSKQILDGSTKLVCQFFDNFPIPKEAWILTFWDRFFWRFSDDFGYASLLGWEFELTLGGLDVYWVYCWPIGLAHLLTVTLHTTHEDMK